MTKKEELAQQLADHAAKVDNYEHVILKGKHKEYWLHMADFIIEDRRRIVEPIKEHKESILRMFGNLGWIKVDNLDRVAMDQALTNAGIELERN